MKAIITHKVSYGFDSVYDGVKEFTSLSDAQRFAADIQHRRTGKTYRRLFEALSRSDKHITFVVPSGERARHACSEMTFILKKLGFDYSMVNGREIKNMDRKFYFLSEAEHKGDGYNTWTMGINPYVIYDVD